jgi:hypothetical protein
MAQADEIKGITFRPFLSLCVKEAWKTSWEKSDTATVIAGIVIGIIVHYRPQWEHAMTSMLWQIPIAALASVVLVRVLLSPWLVYRKRDMQATLAEKELVKIQTGLPITKPFVLPDGYGQKIGNGFGLFIANDNYAANTIYIPEIAIGQTMSVLTFDGILPRLGPNDKDFFEARIKHPDRPERDGSQLYKEMVAASVYELKVGIIYRDTDLREYISNCLILRQTGQPGLTVQFLGQKLLPLAV